MRIVMMGTGPFAVPTFESLLNSQHQVAALITRPSAQLQTRGKTKTAPNPMRDVAVRHGIAVFDPQDVNSLETRKILTELTPELFVVCDYGQILSSETLAIARGGGINLHGSLLPKYRGAAPVNWAIWKGERETGVTVLHMTPKLDAGPSLVQATLEIGADETADQLESRLAKLGVQPVHDAIQMLTGWDGQSALGESQDPSQATKARRLRKNDGLANWSQPAEHVYRQYRAVQRWPGFFTHWQPMGRDPVRIILEKITLGELADHPPSNTTSLPGTILRIDPHALIVATSIGTISIHRLQLAGGRAMDAAAFVCGNPIQVGDRLI
jgi:methionyl-tRNA formyltransferase